MTAKDQKIQACRRKRAYDTPELANAVRTSMSRKSLNPTFLQTYRCSRCGLWHVGNRTPYCWEYGPFEL